jgi:hypothetical protein
MTVPESDLIAPYTKSGSIIVNGLHGSCQSENDSLDHLLSGLDFIATYVSPVIPQKLAEFTQIINLGFYMRRFRNIINV